MMIHFCCKVRALIFAVSLVLATGGCQMTKPLVAPPPVVAAETPAQTRAAILEALIENGYNKRVKDLSKEIASEVWISRATTPLPPVATPPPGEVRTK